MNVGFKNVVDSELIKKIALEHFNKKIKNTTDEKKFLKQTNLIINNKIEACKKNGNKAPVFSEKVGAFVIDFYKKSDKDLNGGINGGINKLFNFIKNNLGKRTLEISNKINIPAKTLEKWIEKLKKQGKVEFRGSKKTGGYYIK
ncbi:hypothetical protein KKG18_03580, partial [Patescibacteria group bacterium]|nr:hypothetical protein [Patescibacteria group bacterium]